MKTTAKEKGIFEDAEKYLEVFGDPPPAGMKTEQSEKFWTRACDQLGLFGQKWNNHPLAIKVGVGMFEYVEIKSKVKAGQKVSIE